MWKVEFFGWDCPLLHVETPWFYLFFDGRVQRFSFGKCLGLHVDSVSKVRDTE